MMSQWQPLNVRRGIKSQPALAEGIPSYLAPSIRAWIEQFVGPPDSFGGTRRDLLLRVGLLAQVSYDPGGDQWDKLSRLIAVGEEDDDTMLNILDTMLHVGSRTNDPNALKVILSEGGSAWAVRLDGEALERRVDPATVAAFAAATAPADAASAELEEAWVKAYGRNPDASDVWDHAIKAVEAVLIPIVCPKTAKATLGNVLGDIKASPARLTMKLATSSTTTGAVETVEAMLRMLWPNPDRHGGSGPTRVPDLDEAQAVLQIAITVVHWVRIGMIS